MSSGARWSLAAAALLSAAPIHAVHAQGRSVNCGYGHRLWRSAVGASLGGWAGLVAMKIRYSDWNDASHSSTGVVGLNRGIAVGAVVGAVLGNLRFRASCHALGADLPQPAPQANRTITLDEIQRSAILGSVYDLVFALRRTWLNTRGIELSETPRVTLLVGGGAIVTPATNPTLVVYLDNVRLGDQEQLRQLPVDGVLEVRFYDAAQATYRWGAGHNHGAIQVLTVVQAER